MLCSCCDRIFSIPHETEMRIPHADHSTYELHSDLRKLQQGTESHCQICRFLWNSMIREEPPPALGDGKEDDISSWWGQSVSYWFTRCVYPLWVNFRIGRRQATPGQSDEKGLEDTAGDKSTKSISPSISASSSSSVSTVDDVTLDLKIYLWDKSQSSGLYNKIFYSPSSPDTKSDDCFSLVKTWVEECLVNHKRFPKLKINDTNQWYPTRLIDLGARSEPYSEARLVISGNTSMDGAYNTLSHCWGKTSFLTLSTDNQETLMEQIPSASLPKTFQDAIFVTRRLGVRYLWIDSLCILQSGPGAKEDWQAESAQMHRVYEGGYCNIAATGSADGNGGLFFDRNPRDIESTDIEIRWFPLEGSYTIVDDDFWHQHLDEAPLSRRAWVVQEYLFAPRIIHFGRRQLFWECSCLHACETHPSGVDLGRCCAMSSVKDDSKFPPSRGKSSLVEKQTPKDCENTEIEDDEFVYDFGLSDGWYKLVERYTSCGLTKEEDKLMALAGVAQRYLETSAGRTCKYLAGLWSGKYLLDNLLWSVRDIAGSSVVHYRPTEYRAPTWSWASVEGRLAWTLRFRVLSPREDRLAIIIDAFTVLKTSHATGQVTGGRLTIQGHLLSARILPGPLRQYNLQFEGCDSPDDIRLDEPAEQPPKTCFCLAVLGRRHREQPRSRWVLLGLALSRVEGGLYKRIGLFHTYRHHGIFGAQEKVQIMIV